MKFVKNYANELIEMFNMYDDSYEWTFISGWLFLAMSFLAGAGMFGIVTMWQTYGWPSLLIDIVVGIPAVVMAITLAIVYAYIAYVLSNVEDDEKTDYYD